MGLPASVVILGLLVDAFEARASSGPKACYLVDRTARRAFAGECRPRHWCCQLSALLDLLVERRIVDLSSAPVADVSPLFAAFALTMVSWDAVAPRARAPIRAHLRFAAADISMKIAFLWRAGFAFVVDGTDSSAAPPWAALSGRTELLAPLRTTFANSAAIARRLETQSRFVQRWLEGHRPSYTMLGLIGEELAQIDGGDPAREHLRLFLHYSLSDLVRSLVLPHPALGRSSWLTEDEAEDIAAVVGRTIRCAVAAGTEEGPREALLAGAFATPPSAWFEHLACHGGEAWAEDLALAKQDYEYAGVLTSGNDFEPPLERFKQLLLAMPLARPPELAARAAARKQHV